MNPSPNYSKGRLVGGGEWVGGGEEDSVDDCGMLFSSQSHYGPETQLPMNMSGVLIIKFYVISMLLLCTYCFETITLFCNLQFVCMHLYSLSPPRYLDQSS